MNINYEGLVCYLNSNKDSKQNNVWLDSSGNNNNATLTSFSDNDFNGSYVQFNGNNYAVIPRCIQDDFTLSAEVILESSTSTAGPWQLWYNYASLIDAETSGVNNDFGLTISKDGHAYFGIGNPDKTIPYAQKSLFNEKHIITCTRKKDTGEYAMYIDGILIKKEIHPNKNSLTYPSEIYVGKGINNRFLSMKLFSIRIYNRVLDNFEIKQDSFFVKNKVYVNENNLPIIVDKLTDAKNIKIANNKYGNRVQTVIDKIVEKADDVTKAIKQEVVNNSYSFKVGTGNINVSADVEDGFGEVGVKGVTYQNILNNFSMDNKASKYITVNENTIKWTKSEVTTFNVNIKYHNSLAQLGKTYTLVFYIYKNTLQREGAGDSYNVAKFNIISYDGGFCLIPVNKTGLVKVKLIQPTTTPTDSKPYLEVFKESVGELEISYPILLEGDCTNDDKIPSQFEGIVGVGDKSKNLLNPNFFKSSTGISMIENQVINIDVPTDGGQRTIFEGLNLPAGTYRVTTKVLEGEYTGGNLIFYDSNGKKFTENRLIGSYTINATNNNINKLLIWAVKGICKIRIQLEKGSSETTYEPYHDGHKIEILSNGKNICNIDKDFKNWYCIGGTNILNTSDKNVSAVLVKCKPNTQYVATMSEGDRSQFATFSSYPKHGDLANVVTSNGVITTGSYDKYLLYYYYSNTSKKVNIQIEEGQTQTSFKPYQEHKTQILLDEPLMRLPNGVHDEITRDGKLIRRVGKIIFNGSENWKTAINNNKSRFDLSLNSVKTPSTWNDKTVPNMICSNLIVQPFNQIYSNGKSGITYYHANSDRLIVISLGNSCSLVEFKQWLSQNPTTVYYELAEPIITELPAPYLRIFKDGHLTFNTLVAPESSHVVQLNKSAQIQNAIKESQSLDNRINVLENNYDNLMLSTISRLNDLELDYTLK